MLVLSRKPGESIVIDGKIRITVTRVRGNRICLGIEAPPSVPVRRGEIPEISQPAAASEPQAVPRLTLASI